LILDLPGREGAASSGDGVSVAYQTFGDGPRAILLMPGWVIAHSDAWRWQVTHLARDYLVVTFDGRGSGASDRPSDAAAYGPAATARDAVAVLDAVAVDRAAILAAAAGTAPAALLAASQRERVAAAVLIGSTLPLAPLGERQQAAIASFDRPFEGTSGWMRWNREAWRKDWWGFLRFYAETSLPEPDSATYIEHRIAMGLETTPAIAAAAVEADRLDEAEARRLAASVGCPALVIHGAADRIAPVEIGVRLAALARAGLHVLPGVGHHPEARHAAQTNALIDVFLERNYAGPR
jgi:pimeloyl-ACP methyl ester carboxylesterase